MPYLCGVYGVYLSPFYTLSVTNLHLHMTNFHRWNGSLCSTVTNLHPKSTENIKSDRHYIDKKVTDIYDDAMGVILWKKRRKKGKSALVKITM